MPFGVIRRAVAVLKRIHPVDWDGSRLSALRGNAATLVRLEAEEAPEAIVAFWKGEFAGFVKNRAKHLLY